MLTQCGLLPTDTHLCDGTILDPLGYLVPPAQFLIFIAQNPLQYSFSKYVILKVRFFEIHMKAF